MMMSKIVRALSAMCVVTALAGAQAVHAQPTASSAPQAVPNADAARDARAKVWLRRVQSGEIDRSQLTPGLSALLDDATVKAHAADFGPLGEPLDFAYSATREQPGGTTIYVYRVRFKSGAMTWWFGLDARGKISALLLNRAGQ
jgi:hypothetical protein